MKLIYFLTTFFATFGVWAAPLTWSDLDAGHLYHSAFKIEMADGVLIHPEQELLLLEKYSLGTPLVFFKFRDMKCVDLSLKTELILFNPDPYTADDSSVGMSYETNCEIDVYVETKDYYDMSIVH